MGVQWLTQKVHNATATICKDMQPVEVELRSPPIRRWIRLVLIVVIGVLLAVAILVMAMRIPTFQTDKVTFPMGQHNAAARLEKLLAEGVRKNQTINCPCHDQIMSWCEVTTFHIYTPAASNASQPFQERLTLIKDDGSDALTTICSSSDKEKQNICESILSPVINSKDSRTYLPTGSAYARPELLYTEITVLMDTNEYEQANSYNYLLHSNDSNHYNYSDGMTQLLRSMADQFKRNSSSSAEDFWYASQPVRANYSSLRLAFGMDVNWTAYLQACDPPFCDAEYQISMVNRVLRAMGQVGGVLTIVGLALKFVLWPLLRNAFRWPSHHIYLATADGAELNGASTFRNQPV